MALAAGEKKKDRRQGSWLGAGHDAFKEDGERKGDVERAKRGWACARRQREASVVERVHGMSSARRCSGQRKKTG